MSQVNLRDSAASTETADRRASARRRASALVHLLIDGSGRLDGKLLDVSQYGARIQLADGVDDLRERQPITVEYPDDDTIRRAGVVAWVSPQAPVSVGIQLTDNGSVALEPVDLDEVTIDAGLALRLAGDRANRWQVLPFAGGTDTVCVAAVAVPAPRVLSGLQRLYRANIEVHLTTNDALRRALSRIYSGNYGSRADGSVSMDRGASIDHGGSIDMDSIGAADEDAVTLCEQLLATATLHNASDLHIDTFEDGVRVRLRVNGQLEDFRWVDAERGLTLISRIKVLSGLDIAERRAPQDGRMRYEHGDVKIDIRVASLPAKKGERLTLRLLARDTDRLTLPRLGMSAHHLELFNAAIRKPHGMVLLTGPTGSGKSTTLYAAIRQLLAEAPLNVITIEDPVEYQIDGITQVEIDQAEKVTFASALRSALRHDPDVIMVGEIRDPETASIAVKAALTGHLVFSTLHTNTAVGAVTRLRDMGVPLYLVAATLRLAVAQRLVRRLCRHCAKAQQCPGTLAAALGRPELEGQLINEPVGCLYCGQRGYSGRLALFEAAPNDAAFAKLISVGAADEEMTALMNDNGLPTITDDATDKLRSGATSAAELLRNVMVV